MYSAIQMVNTECYLAYLVLLPSLTAALLARVTVYGDDDQVLYTSPDIHYNEKNVYFGVDVSGQKQIRVEVSLLKDNEWDDPVILFDGLSLYK